MHAHQSFYAAMRRHGALARLLLLATVLAFTLLAAVATSALAAPGWRVDPLATTTAAPGGTLRYLVQLTNNGDAPLDGTVSPMTFSGTLPAGLTVTDVQSFDSWDCSSVVPGASSFSCTNTSNVIPAAFTTDLTVDLAVDPSASGVLTSTFAVTGGDPSDPTLPSASTVDPTTITPELPSFGIDAFDGQVTSDAAGDPLTQAGGHPFEASTSIDFNTASAPGRFKGEPWPREPVRDVTVDLPPGFVGDPAGIDQCTLGQLANAVGVQAEALCPSTSQIGVAMVRANITNAGTTLGPIPVFNMVPPPNVPARFGFNAAGTVVTLDGSVRSSTDYGVTVRATNVPEGIAMTGTTLTLWGVPADPVHDPDRACPGQPAPFNTGPSCQSGAPLRAFLRNPTSCTAPGRGLPTTVTIDSWDSPIPVTDTFFTHLPPAYPYPQEDWGAQAGTDGCEKVPFTPTIDARPTSLVAGQPSAFTFDVSLPQSDDPTQIGEGDLKKAVVTLPPGVRVNPSSASGLGGCSESQIGLIGTGFPEPNAIRFDTSDPTCPDSSKIGSVTIDTPLLSRPVDGSIYLAAPHDNPFGTLLGLYLVARGPGVILKLPGKIEADPATGQLTSTFDDNPQLPFSNLHLAFKDGPRAPLLNPPTCGTYTTNAQFTAWSGAVVDTSSDFTISQDGRGAPCPGPQFAPDFSAGTESSAGGSSSPLDIRFTRSDGDQELSSVSVHTPPGLLGHIADAVLCGDGAAAAGTCPDGSKIGDVTVGAGGGPNPFYISNGRAYITGPYKGAPFGLSIVVPAIAGPFDLGNVVVRTALFVDKHNATLSAVSDPLPTILQGIPLDVRDVRISIDKPGFIVNPTNCAVQQISGQIASTGGMTANVSNRFQAADCQALGFAPKMALAVGGKGHTRSPESTPLSTRITMPMGDANLRSVKVTLPSTINARLTVINDACTRAEFENDIAKCGHAQAGTAVAVTPLLRDPLRGKVYFVKNGHPIPDLFVALRGQVDFDLIGRITIPGGSRLATTFNTAPDVPIRSFALRLFGDEQNGSIGAAANLCAAKSRKAKASLSFVGQNGKTVSLSQALVVHGCAKPKARRAGRRG